jgi:hypothetical protein
MRPSPAPPYTRGASLRCVHGETVHMVTCPSFLHVDVDKKYITSLASNLACGGARSRGIMGPGGRARENDVGEAHISIIISAHMCVWVCGASCHAQLTEEAISAVSY